MVENFIESRRGCRRKMGRAAFLDKIQHAVWHEKRRSYCEMKEVPKAMKNKLKPVLGQMDIYLSIQKQNSVKLK